jgi:TolB-like protein/DNA-binding CsgD family transcriptional regulator/cytochrome c-type biogenesis protein CcmH/NrfG
VIQESSRAEPKLTPRQLEILGLIAKGLSNKDIALALSISANTVKVHVASLMTALNVSNRTEAVFIHQQLIEGADSPIGREAQLLESLGRPTIAVLPPAIQEGSALAYLPEALAEDLISTLGRWRWFRVLGSAATASYRDADAEEIEAGLGADYCLSGRVSELGSAVRLSLTLMRTSTREIVWSDRSDTAREDLMTFMDDVGRRMIGQMAPELVRYGGHHGHARSFPAWSQAALAMSLIHVPSADNSRAAEEAWERAISLDPELVAGWYAKAAGLYQRVFNQWTEDPRADLDAFREAAERCVSLDITDSSAQEICGFERLVSGRLDDAISHLERAVALNPSNAQAYSELGQALTFSNRVPEAIAALEEALTINPQGDPTWSVRGSLAYAYFVLGEAEQAAAEARRFVAINPSLTLPRAMLAAYLAEAGAGEEATALRRRIEAEDPEFKVAAVIQAYRQTSPGQAERLRQAFCRAGFELPEAS